MRRFRFALAIVPAAMLLATGCATITTDAGQLMRVETFVETGEEVRGAMCRLENENGVFNLSTPGAATVAKSSRDLSVECSTPNRPPAKAVVTSRVGAGMFGNILFGGGVGAIIDHSKGTAYNYPAWLQLVFGRTLSFDRQDHVDGQPTPAFEVIDGKRVPYARSGATAQPAPVVPSATPGLK